MVERKKIKGAFEKDKKGLYGCHDGKGNLDAVYHVRVCLSRLLSALILSSPPVTVSIQQPREREREDPTSSPTARKCCCSNRFQLIGRVLGGPCNLFSPLIIYNIVVVIKK
jgi:hypothetical protein